MIFRSLINNVYVYLIVNIIKKIDILVLDTQDSILNSTNDAY